MRTLRTVLWLCLLLLGSTCAIAQAAPLDPARVYIPLALTRARVLAVAVRAHYTPNSGGLYLYNPLMNNISLLVAGDMTAISWSPDATQIAYATTTYRSGSGDTNEIHRLNLATNATTTLFTLPAGRKVQRLIWSPDGARLAFISADSGYTGAKQELWLLDATGTHPHRLSTPAEPLDPAWSPDSTQILFTIQAKAGDLTYWNIWKIDADGTNLHQLTTNGHSYVARWSPDGTRIAFNTSATQIVVMAVARSADTTLPGGLWPMWAPNGTQIASTEGDAIVIRNLDGTIARTIGLPSYFAFQGTRWAPDGTQFAGIATGDGCKGSILVIAQLDGALTSYFTDDCVQELEWAPW